MLLPTSGRARLAGAPQNRLPQLPAARPARKPSPASRPLSRGGRHLWGVGCDSAIECDRGRRQARRRAVGWGSTLHPMPAPQRMDPGCAPDQANRTPAGGTDRPAGGSPRDMLDDPSSAQARLLQRIAARDKQALAGLYDQVAGVLYSICCRNRLSRSDPEVNSPLSVRDSPSCSQSHRRGCFFASARWVSPRASGR